MVPLSESVPSRSEIGEVVHLVPALFGTNDGVLGGAERYAFELARHMGEVVPTSLVTFGSPTRRYREGALDVHVIDRFWRVKGQRQNPFSLSVLRRLSRTAVVHCHQQHVLMSSVTAAFCRISGRRVFVSDLGGGGWDISAFVSTDRWFHGHLHISEYSRRVRGHEDDPRAHVILGGVDTRKFSPDPSVTPDNSIVFVGRILPHKGVDDLVKALPAGLGLEIIGQAHDEEYLRHLHELADGKKVVFRHNCDDATLVNAYRRGRCVVLPSVYRDMYGNETAVPELLGQTLLEGMACGLPAVCTSVASMPEVVAHEKTGFVVPPNDPDALGERLEWIGDHPDEAAEMGSGARRRVLDRFTWNAVVNRCLAIYAGNPV